MIKPSVITNPRGLVWFHQISKPITQPTQWGVRAKGRSPTPPVATGRRWAFCLGSPGAHKHTSVSPDLTPTWQKPFLALCAGKEGEAKRVEVDGMRHIVKYNSGRHGN